MMFCWLRWRRKHRVKKTMRTPKEQSALANEIQQINHVHGSDAGIYSVGSASNLLAIVLDAEGRSIALSDAQSDAKSYVSANSITDQGLPVFPSSNINALTPSGMEMKQQEKSSDD